MLRRAELAPDPMGQFLQWYEDARAAGDTKPDATILATATRDGRPSARAVLLVDVDADGLVYCTSHHGRKSREIAENPRVALVFLWNRGCRQVRIEGTATPLSAREADARWSRHAPDRRLAEAVTRQSAPVDTREALVARWRALRARHPDGQMPRPEHWGGHRVHPERLELWQEAPDGLHDRFEYARNGAAWTLRRLQP